MLANKINKTFKNSEFDYKVALAGNPNVGKSTLFNALTGMKQHTGNWTGKTVESSSGFFNNKNRHFYVTDLPGGYSLLSASEDEVVAKEHIISNESDCIVIVADSNLIERNLQYALQILSIQKNAVLCLNLSDEAEKNGVYIDSDELSLNLGIPVVKTCASKKKGIQNLVNTVSGVCTGEIKCFRVNRLYENINVLDESRREETAKYFAALSKTICQKCVRRIENQTVNRHTEKLDRILTSKAVGIPIMLAIFGVLFWITAVGANYPSEWLGALFAVVKSELQELLLCLKIPNVIISLLLDGVYTTLSWVVSVMLPPMTIFFPLFSLIEDSGYLPRIAFNLDSFFEKCSTGGKQSLTMSMVTAFV